MTWLSDLPLQRKLRYAMLLTSTVALLSACAVFLTFEYRGYRTNLIQTVRTLARITADNSTAPLAFADAAAAQQTLQALRAEPQVVSATLYDKEAQVFAHYSSVADGAPPAVPPRTQDVELRDGLVVVAVPVAESGRQLGVLYLQATQDMMFARMRTTGWVAVLVLVCASVLAGLLARGLGRTLARPVLELDRTASTVTAEQDYTLRARQYGEDELGRLTVAFNTMMNKTQQSVDALRESEQRFRVMADHAPVLIWLADEQGQFVWLNQRWLDFTGRPLAAGLGRGWADEVHPDDRPRVLAAYDEAAAARQPFQLEYRLRRQDGVYRWVLNQGVPRRGAAGEFAGLIGSSIDVSDRKLAEQEAGKARDRAVAASRAKDNFLAALSHELRTPLTPVLLLATEEAGNRRLADEVRADFEMIAKNVALEARLIDDLLDLTRITRGKLVLDRRSADAHGILQDALATVHQDFADKEIDLRVNLAAPRHLLYGDTVRLQQVFWNVLKNAAKFTPERGRVAVETLVVRGNRLLVRISDNGIGLTPSEAERIFDAFAQGDHADPTAGHRFGGLGLGLAITQSLVQLHAGTIRASSPGRDRGTTIEIELPLESPPVAQPQPVGEPV
jgi:PAS domain S-box-containing protein